MLHLRPADCNAGLVEMARPINAPVKPNLSQFPTQDKEEQKSLINKLIGRIRAI